MPRYPSLGQAISHLTHRLGPPTDAGPELLRWWVHPQPAGAGIALWMHCPAGSDHTSPPINPCEVWATRPFHDDRERCPVLSIAHLDEFIDRIRAATQAGAPTPIGSLCPGPEEPPQPKAIAS